MATPLNPRQVISLATMSVENEMSRMTTSGLRNRKSFNEPNTSSDDSAYGSPGHTNGSWSSSPGSGQSPLLGSPVVAPRTQNQPNVEERPREFWGQPIKTNTLVQDILPIAVVFVIMTSCVVLICTITFGMNRDPMSDSVSNVNGKYKSIAFANEKNLERLKRETKLVDELKDESGIPLGGKKAAIQFAFNAKARQQKLEEPKETDPDAKLDDPDLDKVSFKMASDLMKEIKSAQNEQSEKVESAKEKVLSKRASRDDFRFRKNDKSTKASKE